MAVNSSSADERVCLICSNPVKYYFSRTHPTYPGSPFSGDLNVDYWKCVNCGFVISKTHQDMPADVWAELNSSWHHYGENKGELADTNQPPYLEQALCLAVLTKNKILKEGDILDYASGYGSLAKISSKYLNININIYDKYVSDDSIKDNYVKNLNKEYDIVLNSAMFEHIIDRQSLDIVNRLVSSDGVLMVHTVVCENIPKDENWFYMKPIVHTAFHTNKSMSILMENWGYAQSIYCPPAKSWFLFKGDGPDYGDLNQKIEATNYELQCKYLYHKNGFVDYWKGF